MHNFGDLFQKVCISEITFDISSTNGLYRGHLEKQN